MPQRWEKNQGQSGGRREGHGYKLLFFYFMAGSCQVEIATIWQEEKHRCQKLWLEICNIMFKHPQKPECRGDVTLGSQFGSVTNGCQIFKDRIYKSLLEHQCCLLKDYSFLIEFLLHLCQKPIDHTCVDLIWGLYILFHRCICIYLSIFVPMPHCLDYFSIIENLILSVILLTLFFFKIVLAILVSLSTHINFRSDCLQLQKNSWHFDWHRIKFLDQFGDN